MSVTYLDFDMLIQRADGGYRVDVIESPVGQASRSFSLPTGGDELAQLVRVVGGTTRQVRVGAAPVASDLAPEVAAKTLGGRLYEAVLGGEVGVSLQRSLDEAERQGRGLRIRLRLNDVPELIDLPWEYLYNERANRFLVLSDATPVVRYLHLGERLTPLAVEPPLRVLVMVSSPLDQPILDAEGEWENLQTALKELTAAGRVVLERLDEATLPALQRRLESGQYHIFHYIGHGTFDAATGSGGLMLEGADGKGELASAERLGTLLYDHRTLRLAILNSCEGARASVVEPFGGVAQALVRQRVPAVIAMQFEITDEAAIGFARAFYGSVAGRRPVDAAVTDARQAVFALGDTVEWGTPVLYLRTADGQLFEVERRIRVGPLLVPPRVLAAAAVLALAVVAGVWYWRLPTRMDGRLNIAVADFGVVDPSDSISRGVYETIQGELARLNAEDRRTFAPVAWHDSLGFTQKRVTIGAVTGDTPQARATAVAQKAADLNAHVVVYGAVEGSGSRGRFMPEFYVTRLSGEADELLGRYQLGAPIPVQLPVDPNDVDLQRVLNADMPVRASVVALFTLGLLYDLNGRFQAALDVFEGALTSETLRRWSEGRGEGQEILYFFIGRENLYLNRLDAALAAFEKSVELSPSYARGYLGRGGVYYSRTQALPDAARFETPDLERAIRDYRRASELAQGSPGSYIEANAWLALGTVYRLEAQAHQAQQNVAEAEASFDRAIRSTGDALRAVPESQARFLAHGRLALGVAYQSKGRLQLEKGDRAAALGLLRQAREAYAACREGTTADIFDRQLQSLGQVCQEYQGYAVQEAQAIGGGTP